MNDEDFMRATEQIARSKNFSEEHFEYIERISNLFGSMNLAQSEHELIWLSTWLSTVTAEAWKSKKIFAGTKVLPQHLFPSARFVSKNPHSTVVGLVAHWEGHSWDVFVVNSGSTLPGGGGAWTDFFDEWRKQAAVAAKGYLKA
jgi:hypothetical protein